MSNSDIGFLLNKASKSGDTTTEFQIANSAGKFGKIVAILGLIISVGSMAAETLGGGETIAGVIAGAVVGICGVAMNTLTGIAYVNSRTKVKEAVAGAAQTDILTNGTTNGQ